MAYFQIQHKKLTPKTPGPEQWQYDFWKVEGNERTHLKTKILPRKLSAEETSALQDELKRIYSESKTAIYTQGAKQMENGVELDLH